MLRLVVILLIAVVGRFCAFAQDTDSLSAPVDTLAFSSHHHGLRFQDRILIHPVVPPDSIDAVRLTHKAFWRASAESFGFNMALWSLDRFVQHGFYAYIDWNTIKANFKHGFEWDDDFLGTNMFAHPYMGSLYFNSGRSNGYNFWQSELFAIGGSAMWELFMEREYPSTNDIIATPIGGAALGEVLYRMSDMILDDRATGGERFGRELAAFLVSPMRGFTRIVTGRAWEHRATTGRRFGIPPVSVEVSLGARALRILDNHEGTKAGATASIRIEYGDRFARRTVAPYDYFSFLMELQAMKGQPLLSRVEVIGRLWSKELVDRNKFNLSLGAYQHFDYFDSDTIRHAEPHQLGPCVVPYKLGAPAILGMGTIFRYAPHSHWALDGYLHANGLFLAGILTDYYRDYHRNYNWGSGFSIKMGLRWGLASDRLAISVANQFYRVYTWRGETSEHKWTMPGGQPVDVQGDHSNGIFNHFETRVDLRILQRLYLTCGVDFYRRWTHYRMTIDGVYFPHIRAQQIGCHLQLTHKL